VSALSDSKREEQGAKEDAYKEKHKHHDADVETTVAVAVAAERAKRGVGVRIGDHRQYLRGELWRRVR
jgi:hypothetical protein